MKKTICALCKRDICIDDETVVGQHIRCPYCNGKFSYIADSAELPAEQERAERERVAEERRKDREWKRQLISRIVTTACFLAVIIVGYILINKMLPSTQEADCPSISAEPQKPVEPAPPPAPPQAIVAPVPAPVTESAPPVAPPKAAGPEPVQKIEEPPVAVAPYDEALAAFKDTELAFWEDRKDNQRPCSGQWYCAIPNADDGFTLYKIECADDASDNPIWKLAPKKEPQRVTQQEFDTCTTSCGAIYANGEEAVIRGYGRIDPVSLAIPKKQETTSAGLVYFKKAYPCLKALKVNMSALVFRVEVKRATHVLTVQEVGAEDEIGREPFSDIAQKFLLEDKQKKIGPKDVHIKRPKVTVVECDDRMGGKGANSITKVPRHFPYENVTEQEMWCLHWRGNSKNKCSCSGCKLRRKVSQARRTWTELHDKALEQAAAVAAYEEKVQKEVERLRQEVKVSPREIDGFLGGAKATLRRLPNKP